MTKEIRVQLQEKGWGRHSCILIDASIRDWLIGSLPEAVRELCSIGNLIIITTYDCAVINPCFEQEPWVNVLFAKKLASEVKDFQHGRHERKLHFSIKMAHDIQAFEVNAASIFQFERSNLLSLEKNHEYNIDEETSHSLKYWVAERFRRDVWPDAFNRTIEPRKKSLKKFYKKWNLYISGVYIELDTWDEKTVDQKYQISAIIVIENNKLKALRTYIKSQISGVAPAEKDSIDNFIKSQLQSAFGDTLTWNEDKSSSLGIAIELKTEDQVTLSHQRRFRRLNPYSLSDELPEAPLPAEMQSDS